MNKFVKLLIILMLSTAVASLYAQNEQDGKSRAKLYYKLGGSSVDTTLMNNLSSFRSLVEFFEKVEQSPDVSVKSVTIFSSASMEGDVISNKRLNARRNATALKVIKDIYNVPDSLITCIDGGIAWGELRDSVENSDMQYKEEVLYILDNEPEETWENGTLVDSRNKHLMDLRGGRAYWYMSDRFFPYYRYTKIRIVYVGDLGTTDRRISEQALMDEGTDHEAGLYVEIAQDSLYRATKDTTLAETVPVTDTVAVADTLAKTDSLAAKDSVAAVAPVTEREIPILAFKTNALVLFAGVANAGVEARIADRFSFDLPVIYSPYTIKNNYRLRALAFQPEFRFWFKEFTDGHFIGLTGNFAWFNVALSNNNRYQDSNNRPLMGAGISYGYSWKILPCLSLEFTVGAGYANIHYDVFYNVEDGIKYNSGVKNYWGLTKAGVSVVYILNIKQQGR